MFDRFFNIRVSGLVYSLVGINLYRFKLLVILYRLFLPVMPLSYVILCSVLTINILDKQFNRLYFCMSFNHPFLLVRQFNLYHFLMLN